MRSGQWTNRPIHNKFMADPLNGQVSCLSLQNQVQIVCFWFLRGHHQCWKRRKGTFVSITRQIINNNTKYNSCVTNYREWRATIIIPLNDVFDGDTTSELYHQPTWWWPSAYLLLLLLPPRPPSISLLFNNFNYLFQRLRATTLPLIDVFVGANSLSSGCSWSACSGWRLSSLLFALNL